MKRQRASAVYLSGKIVERGIYFFSSRLDALPDGEYSHAEISAYNKGQFFYQERDMQVQSVCIRRETPEEPVRASCALPRFNSVVGFYPKGGGGEYDEMLPSSPNAGGGVMGQLRFIDGKLYAAGSVGCIFKRVGRGNWVAINKGLNTKGAVEYEKEGFSWREALEKAEAQVITTCINGRNGKIFSAGHNGEVFFLKAEKWVRVDSRTNATLRDIAVNDSGVFYICGKNGTLIMGDERGFLPISSNIDDYLKSMAFFNGDLYVGGSKGLYKLAGQSLQPVRTNQNAPFNCVELDAYDGELLVVSDRWFLVFDGVNWRRIDDPDNAEVLQ
ncbi:hypothetical protein [Paracidovorax oryzae]|uniref:hypothetical protein n=1 Tax=Paracidovorax oryzae TaxID=862720 RepID=UPI0012FF2B2F|nr:hypothetical protein [Paracidovorax oryzae]